MEFLEKQHPLHKGIGVEATMEQRAFFQIKVQEYEQILTWLRSMQANQKLASLPSEYKADK